MKNILTHKVRQSIYWMRRQPLILKLRKRFPGLVNFIENRFNTKKLYGLPLTLLLLAYLCNVALLSELTEDVVESDGIVVVDFKFTELLYSMRSTWMSNTLYFFTQLGSRLSTYIVGGILTLTALYKKQYIIILAFWLTMGGVGLSVQYGKKYISRNRPAEVAYYAEPNFSFPSGHATTAIAQFGMVAYFLFRLLQAVRLRRIVVGIAAGLIIIIGFSRIYLGVHFLSDVIAGFLLGGMWLLMGISLVEIMNYKARRLTSI